MAVSSQVEGLEAEYRRAHWSVLHVAPHKMPRAPPHGSTVCPLLKMLHQPETLKEALHFLYNFHHLGGMGISIVYYKLIPVKPGIFFLFILTKALGVIGVTK